MLFRSGYMGDDTLMGEDGDDSLIGGMGDDQLRGGDGDDALHGNDGDDAMDGGAGADTLFGGAGDDALLGINADLSDSNDADFLNGGDDDDEIVAGSYDTVHTGSGADTVVLGDWITSPTDVQDFDPAEDSLMVVFNDDGTEPDVTLTDDGQGTFSLMVDGQQVATLGGADGLALDQITLISNTDFATLMAG